MEPSLDRWLGTVLLAAGRFVVLPLTVYYVYPLGLSLPVLGSVAALLAWRALPRLFYGRVDLRMKAYVVGGGDELEADLVVERPGRLRFIEILLREIPEEEAFITRAEIPLPQRGYTHGRDSTLVLPLRLSVPAQHDSYAPAHDPVFCRLEIRGFGFGPDLQVRRFVLVLPRAKR